MRDAECDGTIDVVKTIEEGSYLGLVVVHLSRLVKFVLWREIWKFLISWYICLLLQMMSDTFFIILAILAC